MSAGAAQRLTVSAASEEAEDTELLCLVSRYCGEECTKRWAANEAYEPGTGLAVEEEEEEEAASSSASLQRQEDWKELVRRTLQLRMKHGRSGHSCLVERVVSHLSTQSIRYGGRSWGWASRVAKVRTDLQEHRGFIPGRAVEQRIRRPAARLHRSVRVRVCGCASGFVLRPLAATGARPHRQLVGHTQALLSRSRSLSATPPHPTHSGTLPAAHSHLPPWYAHTYIHTRTPS